MNILYFGTYEASYSRNQIMIKSLKKLGHTVKECHVSLWGNKIDKTRTFVGVLSKLVFILRLLTIYPRLFLKYLFIGRHDIIFVGYFGHLDMFFAKLFTLILLKKKKIVFDAFLSLYDSMVSDRKILKEASLSARLVYFIDKHACQIADTVILDTNAHINFFHETFGVPKDKMIRIFAGAETDIFYPREMKKKDNTLNVLFMGKYTPLHGIEYIVEAADILKNDRNIQFTFIGNGQLYKKIRSMVEDKQLDNIEFIDWVEYEELPKYIAMADVCLGVFATSEKASRVIPNKVFQAMASGVPVLTEDSPGSRELLVHGANALLCKAGNGQSIAYALRQLFSEVNVRRKLGIRGYETFKRDCSFEHTSSTLETLLNNI